MKTTEYWAFAAGKRRGRFTTELDAMEALILDPHPLMSIYTVVLDARGNVLEEPKLHWGAELRD